MVEDGDIGDILMNGVYGAVGGAVGGAVTGGIVGGAVSYFKGENVWTGAEISAGRNAFSLKNTPKLSVENQSVRIGGSMEQDPLLNNELMSPHTKSEMGMQEAVSDFLDQGGEIYSREVTVEIDGIQNRFDFVGKLNGELHLVEVKNGLNAGFTPNQRINLPKYLMNKPTLISRGAKALQVKYPEFNRDQIYKGNYIVIIKHYF